jgi:hypothetical protein
MGMSITGEQQLRGGEGMYEESKRRMPAGATTTNSSASADGECVPMTALGHRRLIVPTRDEMDAHFELIKQAWNC